MNILMSFNCRCGWKEDIGVDVRTGIVIRGDITLICPNCLSITVAASQVVITPIKPINARPTNGSFQGP